MHEQRNSTVVPCLPWTFPAAASRVRQRPISLCTPQPGSMGCEGSCHRAGGKHRRAVGMPHALRLHGIGLGLATLHRLGQAGEGTYGSVPALSRPDCGTLPQTLARVPTVHPVEWHRQHDGYNSATQTSTHIQEESHLMHRLNEGFACSMQRAVSVCGGGQNDRCRGKTPLLE